MACLNLSGTLRRSLLTLPPHLRTSTLHATRPFSASHPYRISVVDLAVAGPSALLDVIHSLGIPWHTTLPLTAVIVRTTLVYFLSIRPRRRKQEIQNQIYPLTSAHTLMAWNSHGAKVEREKERAEQRTGGRMASSPGGIARRDALRRWSLNRKVSRALQKIYGAGGFRPFGLVNFGLLIAFTEAVRLKCAAREGLLPLLLNSLKWIGNQTYGRVFPGFHTPETPANTESAESLANSIQSLKEQKLAMAQAPAQAPSLSAGATETLLPEEPSSTPELNPLVGESSDVLPPSIPDVRSQYFDPSMEVEGFSWVTNLTLADPTWFLPGMLSVTWISTAYFRPRPASAWSSTLKRAFSFPLPSVLQRLGMAIGFAFFFAAINMPSAVLLYFIPSIAVGWLQQRWLDWKYPIQPAITPCARPIRVKVRRGW